MGVVPFSAVLKNFGALCSMEGPGRGRVGEGACLLLTLQQLLSHGAGPTPSSGPLALGTACSMPPWPWVGFVCVIFFSQWDVNPAQVYWAHMVNVSLVPLASVQWLMHKIKHLLKYFVGSVLLTLQDHSTWSHCNCACQLGTQLLTYCVFVLRLLWKGGPINVLVHVFGFH